jgi:hypothetical protein
MNWDALGAIAEAVAALTVIITLLLLLKQLKSSNVQAQQANNLARAASQRDILKQVADHATLAIANPELQADIRLCYENWEEAPASAKWNFESWASAYFYVVEQAIYMHDDGLLSDETYLAMEAAAIRIVQTPGGDQWWSRKSQHIGAGVSRRITRKRDEIGAKMPPMFGLSSRDDASE